MATTFDWLNPSPGTREGEEPDSLTPEKESSKQRARRGSVGTFKGKRPPKKAAKLEAFLAERDLYYKQKQQEQWQKTQSCKSDSSETTTMSSCICNPFPMRMEKQKPGRKTSKTSAKGQSPWHAFVKAEWGSLPADLSFSQKTKALAKKWADRKLMPEIEHEVS